MRTVRTTNRFPVVKAVAMASLDMPTTSRYLKGVTAVNIMGRTQKVRKRAARLKVMK